MNKIFEINITQDFIPVGRANRPGKANQIEYITIHNTGDVSMSAIARNYAIYLKESYAANTPSSWHYTTDGYDIIQHLPDNEVASHIDENINNIGNNNSISIKICMDKDGRLFEATNNAALLTAYLCDTYNIPIQNVVQHNFWTGKNCPKMLRRGKPYSWDTFIKKVKKLMDGNAKTLSYQTLESLKSSSNIIYRAQTGMFKCLEDAEIIQAELKDKGLNATFIFSENAYRKIHIAAFNKKSDAEIIIEQCKSLGYEAVIKELIIEPAYMKIIDEKVNKIKEEGKMKSEYIFAIELCKLHNNKKEIENLLEQSLDYALVFDYLVHNRIAAAAYNKLKECGLLKQVNNEFKTKLKAIYKKNKKKSNNFCKALVMLANMLDDSFIPYALLNNSYLITNYPNRLYVPDSIDILIDRECISMFCGLLQKNGFAQGCVKNNKFIQATFDEITDIRINTGEIIPFIKKTNLPNIKFLQINIKYNLESIPDNKIIETFLKRSEKMINNKLAVICPVDSLIQRCIDIYKQSPNISQENNNESLPLYKLRDLYMVINNENSEHFFEDLAKRIIEIDLQKECHYIFTYTKCLFNINNDKLNIFINNINPDNKLISEHRFLLTKDKFNKLLNFSYEYFRISSSNMFIDYFYDDDNFSLHRSEAELKISHINGSLELQCNNHCIGENNEYILSSLPYSIIDKYRLQGSVVTNRRSFKNDDEFKIFLDENSYLGRCDYEIIIENTDAHKKKIDDIINKFNLCTLCQNESKAVRFFKKLREIM